jgi:phenylpyruvate tautomerase PptA (4-oxalocrotonate tautomerase family)
MPLVRISLPNVADRGRASTVGDAVHRALVEAVNVPADDKFQIITSHEAGHIVYPDRYLGIAHGPAVTIVQITLNTGRTVEQKRALFAKIADYLEALGIPRADVIVNLVEVVKENWSFGDGVAQYAN